MKRLRRVSDRIARVETSLLLFMLFSIVGVNLMQIGIRLLQSLLRTVGSDMVLSAPSWPADVNRVLVLWITMVGGSLATRSNEHIKVDFFSRLLPERPRFLVNALISVAGIVVSLLLVFFSIEFLKMEHELAETLVAVPIPLWIIQLIIPVGFCIIAFRFFLHLAGGTGAAGHPKDPDAEDSSDESSTARGGAPC
jgi:TRAP-type C4-dicarboxylate transport system permease small subunit